MTQGTLWKQPKLDRTLLMSDALAADHIRDATNYLSWAWDCAARGVNPHTPTEPMKLPGARVDWTE